MNAQEAKKLAEDYNQKEIDGKTKKEDEYRERQKAEATEKVIQTYQDRILNGVAERAKNGGSYHTDRAHHNIYVHNAVQERLRKLGFKVSTEWTWSDADGNYGDIDNPHIEVRW
jgi:hypothetical protein